MIPPIASAKTGSTPLDTSNGVRKTIDNIIVTLSVAGASAGIKNSFLTLRKAILIAAIDTSGRKKARIFIDTFVTKKTLGLSMNAGAMN